MQDNNHVIMFYFLGELYSPCEGLGQVVVNDLSFMRLSASNLTRVISAFR